MVPGFSPPTDTACFLVDSRLTFVVVSFAALVPRLTSEVATLLVVHRKLAFWLLTAGPVSGLTAAIARAPGAPYVAV